jgi:hypothetical protein
MASANKSLDDLIIVWHDYAAAIGIAHNAV